MIAGTHITIEGIRFKILSLDIQNINTSTSSFGRQVIYVPISNEIKMVAETTTNYYITLEKWRDNMFGMNGISKPAYSFKRNIIKNGVQIIGIFPIDYFFKEDDLMEVTFSIDHIDGDLKLFQLKQERLEKIKKLNSICQ